MEQPQQLSTHCSIGLDCRQMPCALGTGRGEKRGPGQDRMKIACKLAALICKTKAQQRLFVLVL